MLEGLSNRVPTGEELDRAEEALWEVRGPTEWLEMNLDRIETHGRTVGRDSDVPTELAEPFTAEQAWRLTHFANGVEGVAMDLTEWAGNIRRRVRTIYRETLEKAEARKRAEA